MNQSPSCQRRTVSGYLSLSASTWAMCSGTPKPGYRRCRAARSRAPSCRSSSAGARLDLHLAGVVRRDRGYHNPSPVDVRHVGFGVEPLARAGVLLQRPDQSVRHVAFERIGRVEQFEDYEIQRESPVDTVDVDRVDPVSVVMTSSRMRWMPWLMKSCASVRRPMF